MCIMFKTCMNDTTMNIQCTQINAEAATMHFETRIRDLTVLFGTAVSRFTQLIYGGLHQ